MDMKVRVSGFNCLEHFQYVREAEPGQEAALNAHLGNPRCGGNFAQYLFYGQNKAVSIGAAASEGTKEAAIPADIGVVNVSIMDKGYHVMVDLAVQGVSKLYYFIPVILSLHEEQEFTGGKLFPTGNFTEYSIDIHLRSVSIYQ